jgi:murein DD-endopeptidase MepM/ murein hydrolase activator NlpD
VRESIEVKQPPSVGPSPGVYTPAKLLTRLGLLGGLSILSGGTVLAQTTLEIPAAAPPIAELAAPQPVVQAAPLPGAVAPPEQFRTEFPQASAQPAPSVNPQLTPALVNPRSVPASRADIPLVQADAEGYDAPSAVIVSERSSGCEVTLKQGQEITQALCGRQPLFSSPLAKPTMGLADSGAAPAMAEVSDDAAPRSGPFGFSSVGVNVNLPSIKPYFNRTARPLGRPGNGNVSLLFPLAIPAPITSLFGWRTHPLSGDNRFHSGTDLGAPMGTPVLAALAGQVALADFLGGYGLAVTLDHSKGTQQTLYAHLSEVFVKPGEWVKQGTVIGRVGSTGASTGPHLHFEFRQLTADGWVAQDPGLALEQALAQLMQAMQVAQGPNQVPLQSGQPLPSPAEVAAKTAAANRQAQQMLELARQLAIQANQPLQHTAYNAQKAPIGRLASVLVAE